VLLDIVMPGLDGVSVLEQLKADAATQHVPVIMISAVDGLDSVVKSIEMGAGEFQLRGRQSPTALWSVD
jgi:adenylate cyclase